jgi:hypothetical protein
MTVLNIYSPGYPLSVNATLFVANPWATSDNPAADTWIQCTTNLSSTDSGEGFLSAVGIIEYEYINGNGQVQQVTFGDISDLADVNIFDLPAILFVRQLLSVTTAYIEDGGGIGPCLTLFQWG